jgi:hypothetical protein
VDHRRSINFELLIERLVTESGVDQPFVMIVPGAAPINIFPDEPGERFIVVRGCRAGDQLCHDTASSAAFGGALEPVTCRNKPSHDTVQQCGRVGMR